jgi:hypothetical protein
MKIKTPLMKILRIIVWITVFIISYSLIKYLLVNGALWVTLALNITPTDFENFSGIVYGVSLLFGFGGGFYFADKAYNKIKVCKKKND